MNNFEFQFKISDKTKEIVDTRLLHYIELECIYSTNINLIDCFDFIVFKNFYTNFIDIFILDGQNEWKSVLTAYKLMEDNESDRDSEKIFIIEKQKLSNFINTNKLRIYLIQDSLLWKDFTIKSINFYKSSERSKINNIGLNTNTDKIKQIYKEIASNINQPKLNLLT